MRIPDFHVHTHFSPDSHTTPEEAVKAALQNGVTDLCFTDHMDPGHPDKRFDRIPPFANIKECIRGLRESCPQLNLRFGVETGYIAGYAEQIVQALQQESFDFVLLSTHCVDGADCYPPEAKRGQSKEVFYTRYLETVYESVADARLWDSYDCVSHIGFIAKCGHYEDNTLAYDFSPALIDAILTQIIQNGKGIEVNTSGLARAGHLLPHPTILSRYRQLGGWIVTIGSDAHTPQRIGGNVRIALQTLRECGFTEYALYNQRKVELIALDESSHENH